MEIHAAGKAERRRILCGALEIGTRRGLHQFGNDRAEPKALSKAHPEIVARLSKLALDWKATLPEKPNPDCISKDAQQPAQKKPPVNPKSE